MVCELILLQSFDNSSTILLHFFSIATNALSYYSATECCLGTLTCGSRVSFYFRL